MFFQHPSPHPRQGFNLIEAAIVLGVVGLVIGGIWVAAAAVSDRMKQRQLAEGLEYFARQVEQKFPASITSKFTADTDLNGFMVSNVPMPAGWSIGGPWNNYPVDPYGNPLYIQIQAGGGGFLFGYYGGMNGQPPISGSACQAAVDFLVGTMMKKFKPTYISFHAGNGSCMVDSTNYTSYASDKLNILRTCCPNDSLGFYADLPR